MDEHNGMMGEKNSHAAVSGKGWASLSRRIQVTFICKRNGKIRRFIRQVDVLYKIGTCTARKGNKRYCSEFVTELIYQQFRIIYSKICWNKVAQVENYWWQLSKVLLNIHSLHLTWWYRWFYRGTLNFSVISIIFLHNIRILKYF